MSNVKLILFSLIVLAGLCPVKSARAAEPLIFDGKPLFSAKINVSKYLAENKDTNITNPLIAQADLNDDGIAEIIVRDAGCAPVRLCEHLILADTDSGIVRLGRIEARQILLANGYSHGVRDLMAAQNPANDFDQRRYVWEPLQSRYTMAGDDEE